MKTKIALTFVILCTALVSHSFANPGDLDTTFGTGGIYTDSPPFYPCYGMTPGAMTLQTDGKILVVGTIYDKCSYSYDNDPIQGRRVLLRRYLSNGSPDDSFGMNGFAVNQIGGPVNVYGATAGGVAVQADGSIVVVGSKNSRLGIVAAIWRFLPTGELDTTFGTGGGVTFSATSGATYANRVAISSGKIVVAGDERVSSSWNIWVRKLNSNGSIDSTFSSGGKLDTGLRLAGSAPMFVNPANGHIFIGGLNSNDAASVRKFFPSGTLYTNFGIFGTAVLASCAPGPDPYLVERPIGVYDIQMQSSTKLLISMPMTLGQLALTSGTKRLTAGGGADTTFGDPTCNTVHSNSNWIAIAVAANDLLYQSNKRYFPDGQPDASFTLAYAGPYPGAPRPAKVQLNDGKIIYLETEYVPKQNQSGTDTRPKLIRALP